MVGRPKFKLRAVSENQMGGGWFDGWFGSSTVPVDSPAVAVEDVTVVKDVSGNTVTGGWRKSRKGRKSRKSRKSRKQRKHSRKYRIAHRKLTPWPI